MSAARRSEVSVVTMYGIGSDRPMGYWIDGRPTFGPLPDEEHRRWAWEPDAPSFALLAVVYLPTGCDFRLVGADDLPRDSLQRWEDDGGAGA